MYKPNTILTQWIASLPTYEIEKLDRLYEWNYTQLQSCTEGLLRSDQAYDQRLSWLHKLLDCETLDRALLSEFERRNHVPCQACGDEGHVESEDYPHSMVVECKACC